MLSLAFSWNRARTDTDTPCARCTTRVSTQHEYARAARAQVAFGSNPGQKNVAQLRPPRAPMRKGMSVHISSLRGHVKKMKHEKRKRHCQRMTLRFFVELICSPLFFFSSFFHVFSPFSSLHTFSVVSHFCCLPSFTFSFFLSFFLLSFLCFLLFFFPFFFPPPSLFLVLPFSLSRTPSPFFLFCFSFVIG